MSAPVNQGPDRFVQPTFTAPTAADTEPTNDELYSLTARPPRRDWTKGIVLAALVAVLIAALGGIWHGITAYRTAAANPVPSTHAQAPEPTCKYPFESTAPSGSTYCATESEYEQLMGQAEHLYQQALKRGKPVYVKWLTAHKLDKAKTESASEAAARTYICQSDYGDGALYAATKAGVGEDEIEIAIGDLIVPVDGYDPTDVRCDGKKPTSPQNPKPSLDPKDPERDPAANGNAPRPQPSAPSRGSPGQPDEIQAP